MASRKPNQDPRPKTQTWPFKSFLVGGAVRDQLLGLNVLEKDYVVVGATPEQMVSLGFQPVGKDFPVFLHPDTKEEYALARTERKIAPGHHGFKCNSSPDVTLEEDLYRRDLTINAMAIGADGKLFDPYGGQTDIKHKTLRHVSRAFVEDPLRIFRVARFAAKLEPLGFQIAPETLTLMQDIVSQGELTFLAKERIWQETSKALQTQSPHTYFEVLQLCGAWEAIVGSTFPKPLQLTIVQRLAQLKKTSTNNQPTKKALYAALTLDLRPYYSSFELLNQAFEKGLFIPKRYALFARQVQHIQSLYLAKEIDIDALLEFYNQTKPWHHSADFYALKSFWQNIDLTQAFQLPKWALNIFEPMEALCQIKASPFISQGLKGVEISQAIHQARRKLLLDFFQKNRAV